MIATDILSNRILYEVLRDRITAESLLSPSTHSTSSLLQPVSFRPQHFEEIAEAMIRNKTIHSLADDKALLSHAKSLDSLAPTTRTCDETFFRYRYWKNLSTCFTTMLQSQGAQLSPPLLSGLETLTEWLTTQSSRGELRQSDVWRFIEAHCSPTLWTDLKSASDTAYQYTIATAANAYFSVSHEATVFADCVQQSLLQTKRITSREHTVEIEEVVTTFPVNVVKHLTFAQVVQLREEKPFKHLRKLLEQFSMRQGGPESLLEQIHQSLNNCTDPLLELLSRRLRYRRKSYVAYLKEEDRKARIRIFNKIGVHSIPPVLALLSGTLQPIAALVAVNGVFTWFQSDWRGHNINYARTTERYLEFLESNESAESTQNNIEEVDG
jgi:hypothetical protein